MSSPARSHPRLTAHPTCPAAQRAQTAPPEQPTELPLIARRASCSPESVPKQRSVRHRLSARALWSLLHTALLNTVPTRSSPQSALCQATATGRRLTASGRSSRSMCHQTTSAAATAAGYEESCVKMTLPYSRSTDAAQRCAGHLHNPSGKEHGHWLTDVWWIQWWSLVG